MAFIEVDGVTKRYRQKLALDRVSFEVNRGECYGTAALTPPWILPTPTPPPG